MVMDTEWLRIGEVARSYFGLNGIDGRTTRSSSKQDPVREARHLTESGASRTLHKVLKQAHAPRINFFISVAGD